jgi:polysaccharide deacetylase 2 family uncharacterized protein YibQ
MYVYKIFKILHYIYRLNSCKFSKFVFQITILDALSTNPCYEDLREFYADYNNISSINKLEGSKFLDNYAFLSLRYNKIKSVSKKMYFFDDIKSIFEF